MRNGQQEPNGCQFTREKVEVALRGPSVFELRVKVTSISFCLR